MTSAAPALVFAFELQAHVSPPLELGDTVRGRRRIVPTYRTVASGARDRT